MKVFLCPNPNTINKYNGIGRVLHAQVEYLPNYGIEFVTSEDKADVVACHTHQFDCKRVDALHLHGIYWTGDPESGIYNRWHSHANRDIVKSTRRANKITVPADWVGEFLRRDFKIEPTVIPHGIDLDEWQPALEHKDYIFWAKNRPSDVCSPEPMYQLTARLPNVAMISTFAPVGKPILSNLTVCGALDPGNMHEYLQTARVYLATTHETWGITTAEAMASGVPVLGYRWGGTAEIVKHKVTGWLAEPGDIEGLAEGYQFIIDNWDELSEACIEDVKNLTWEKPMQMYANLYQQALEEREKTTHKVSIVITNYNYGEYLNDSVSSALEQKVPCEVIVVNDGSTDDSLEKLKPFADKIKVIQQKNQGVAASRNNGIRAATGDYIICLDADDMLKAEYVETLLPAFKADRGLGIAYTGMELKTPEGYRVNNWPPDFKWEILTEVQIPPASCIHCAAMFRKSMWEKAGGYRQMYAPAEDTEFWLRGLAYGYTAERVTADALFVYRVHANSASKTKVYNRIDYWHPWMRDKKYPAGAPSTYVPLIRSYARPVFSLVFEGEQGTDAFIESLLGQTFRNWEVLEVVDKVKYERSAYPFIKFTTEAELADKAKSRVILRLSGKVLHPETLQQIIEDLRNGSYTDTINYKLYEIEIKEGKRIMPCSTCGGSVSPEFLERLRRINQMDDISAGTQEYMLQATDAGAVRMRFIGESFGGVSFGGPGVTPSGQAYRGGANPFDQFINADPRDIDWLRNSGFWAVVPPPPPEPVQAISAQVEVPKAIETLNLGETPKVKVEYKHKKERAHMQEVKNAV